jgi:hypothetical protein
MAEAEDLVDPGVQGLSWVCRRLDLGAQACRRGVGLAPEQRAEQLVLRFEMPVEGARRQLGLAQDVCHCRIGVTVALHDHERGIQEDAELVLGLEATGPPRPGRRRCLGHGTSSALRV